MLPRLNQGLLSLKQGSSRLHLLLASLMQCLLMLCIANKTSTTAAKNQTLYSKAEARYGDYWYWYVP